MSILLFAIAAVSASSVQRSFSCEVSRDDGAVDEIGHLEIHFMEPDRSRNIHQRVRLSKIKLDDKSKLLGFLVDVNLSGETSQTGVVEIFPRAEMGPNNAAWLRLVPDYRGPVKLTASYVSASAPRGTNPVVLGDAISGKCTEVAQLASKTGTSK